LSDGAASEENEVGRILIVDDDPDFIDAMRIVLEKEGHSISSARSGSEALRRMRRDPPDLVILDIIMDAVLEGLSVSQAMRDDPSVCQVPIIMVTSIANTDYGELFSTDESIHSNCFLTKPIKPAELVREVDRLLRDFYRARPM
jgi:CheY-like chemotaxis protein